MTEPTSAITQLELSIAGRVRLLAVQDLLALAALFSAALVVLALVLLRLGLFEARISEGIGIRARLVLFCVPVGATAALLIARSLLRRRGRWQSSLNTSAERVDLIIDRSLGLEDRASTAGSIIRRGGPQTLMETALVADAASRLDGASAGQIVEYRLPRLGSAVRCPATTGSAIVLALIVLVGVLHYRLPARSVQEPDSGTIAVMQAVGDDLERSSEAIEQSVDQNTPTAALAKQQAELAHALKQSAASPHGSRAKPIDRSQALKELSALEEKLGARKDQLASTKAPEIISLAERRFQSALSGTARLRQTPPAGRRAGPNPEVAGASAGLGEPPARGNRNPDDKVAGAGDLEPKSESGPAAGQARSDKPAPTGSLEPRDSGSAEPRPAQGSTESKPGIKAGDESQKGDGTPEGKQPNGPQVPPKDETIATSALGKAVDAMASTAPSLSQDLLKKAVEMRAGSLTAADIERVRKAAEGLLKDLSAKDLANLANSKEIQQTLEQLARQVDPKQMEQLARQLLSQKEIRDELQAAGKLLMENRQAKETIAGFADKAREIAEQFRKQGFKPGGPPDSFQGPPDLSAEAGHQAGSEPGSWTGFGGAKRGYRHANGSAEALRGMGRSGGVAGRSGERNGLVDSKLEGEQIYGSTRPGAAPARVPYSSAYPGYRREAERSVRTSQAPPRLRVLIRNYFDGINPDAEKKP
jgi:hypothetical protein